MQSLSYLYGQVHVTLGHLTQLVSRHQNLDVHKKVGKYSFRNQLFLIRKCMELMDATWRPLFLLCNNGSCFFVFIR